MEYTRLGRTGLDVSRICLDCMSYGAGNHGQNRKVAQVVTGKA